MKIFTWFLGILGLFLLSLPLLLLFILLEDEANYPTTETFGEQQIVSIQELILQYDPSFFTASGIQRLELNQAETNAVLAYLSRQMNSSNIPRLEGLSASISLAPDTASLSGSLAIRPTVFGRYINYEAGLVPQGKLLRVQSLSIAGLSLPAFILEPMLEYVRTYLQRQSNYQFAESLLSSVTAIQFDDDYLGLGLNWDSANISRVQNQARRLLIDPASSQRLLAYQQVLHDTVLPIAADSRTTELHRLLVPLFSHALADPGDPRTENQEIFLILSCYLLNELSLEDLLGSDAALLESPPQLRVTIESRDDLPRHLVASAAIAAYADDNLANLLAVYKEVYDSRSSSGFSFSDMTANMVGTRIGILSSDSREQAQDLQRFFAAVETDSAYMPVVGPPDGISEAEFARLYDNRTSPAYLQQLQEIEAEIEELSVFRPRQP